MRYRTVTIRDIAQAVGVSIATVSHAFNSTGRITENTRERVLSVARRLKYYPNHHARNLAAGSNKTFGIVVSDLENPFFAVAIKNFEAEARNHGREVILSATNYEIALMQRAAERMLEQKVAGVAILTSEMSSNWLEEILQRNIPVVCFDLAAANDLVINLQVDYQSGMREVIRHLYGLGHRYIAFAGGRTKLRNVYSRQESFLACMHEYGLTPGPLLAGNQSLDGGYQAGLMALQLDILPTAIVAMNDLTAIGLIKAFDDHGILVPNDISVTGFDNTFMAEYFVPRLTTVDLHPARLGQIAAQALEETSQSSRLQGKVFSFNLDLVVGRSTGAAPRRGN
jgi:DNA-binding LacI/PurR family transcriptional regulator